MYNKFTKLQYWYVKEGNGRGVGFGNRGAISTPLECIVFADEENEFEVFLEMIGL